MTNQKHSIECFWVICTRTTGFHRSRQDLEEWAIETALELEGNPEINVLLRLHEKYRSQIRQRELPETPSAATYRDAA